MVDFDLIVQVQLNAQFERACGELRAIKSYLDFIPEWNGNNKITDNTRRLKERKELVTNMIETFLAQLKEELERGE